MQIPESQCDETSLAALGAEASDYIAQGAHQRLASRFGYALAFGKDPAEAIKADVEACLSKNGAPARLASPCLPEIKVTRFKAGNGIFVALVECNLPVIDSSEPLLAELIVTKAGDELHVTLEQISRMY